MSDIPFLGLKLRKASPEDPIKIAILISGRGSNMRALVEAVEGEDIPARIVGVISNRPKAAGLDYARGKGIEAIAIDHRKFENREAFEAAMQVELKRLRVDMLCNAGFMRLLTPSFVHHWYNRQLNIHPSLLPAYKGLHTHRRVLEEGGCITGCTVHFVRNEMDEGPIIAQAAVPVMADDNEESLAARVLEAEHKLYPFALKLITTGEAEVQGEKIKYNTSTHQFHNSGAILFSPSHQAQTLPAPADKVI